MEQPIIKVKMLGDFSVSYNGNMLISESNRSNNVIHLFQYLLLKRNQAVRQDELISNLLDDSDEYDDPVHTLKNIVYRLRKFLASSGFPDRDYIYFQKGAYGLSRDIEFDVDIERFEFAVKSARTPSLGDDDRLRYCMQAISLYDGDFLPKSSGLQWVMPRVVCFQEMYFHCLKTAYEIMKSRRDLAPMTDLLQKALSVYPYEEQLHVMYISCLYSLNRMKEAVSRYDIATALLFDELGVSPSAEMQELYGRIAEALSLTANSIEDIRTDMSEESMNRGAYFCNFQVFSNAYRVFVRQAERSGQSAYLVLMTLTNNGGTAEMSDRLKKAPIYLGESIKTSLRRGDLYTRFSPSQFMIMLMDINLENCKIVSYRIIEKFHKQMKDKSVKLSSQVLSAIDVENVMNA